MNDAYNTITAPSAGLFKDKGSRFISYLFPVSDENDIKELLANLRKEHHSARHHCYAWRLGSEEIRARANDDGEPSSTAGKPILGQLVHHGLTNVLLVVVRYFGGTLLGVSGLVHAYREAAADAIRNAKMESRNIEAEFEIDCTYAQLNNIMQLIRTAGFNHLHTQMTDTCKIRISVRKSDAGKAEETLSQYYGIQYRKL